MIYNSSYLSISQMLHTIFSVIVVLLLTISPILVSAQALTQVENECGFAPTRSNFQIQTALSSQNVTAGRQLSVDVTLRNNTVSTVSDVSLLLLIYKKMDQNNTVLTDYIHINDVGPVDGNSESTVSYIYDVPTALTTGEYLLRVMPVFGNRHSYSERVALPAQAIQGVSFLVNGSLNERVLFSDISLTQDRITSEDGVNFVLPNMQQVPVHFSLSNNAENLATGNFNWHLYDGRVVTDTTRVASGREEAVTIQSQSSASKSIQIPLSNSGEYTLLLKYETDDGLKSHYLFNITLQNVSDVRILNATQINPEGTMLICLEQYGFGTQDPAELSLVLNSEDEEDEFNTNLTARVSQTPVTFSLNFNETFSSATNIRLSSGNSTIEQWYLCESDFVDCPIEEEDNFNPFLLVLTVVLIISGVLILFIIRRKL